MRRLSWKLVVGAGIAAGIAGAATEIVVGAWWAAAIIAVACVAWLRFAGVRGWPLLPVLTFRLQLRLRRTGRLFRGRKPRPEPHKSTLPDPAGSPDNQED